jgi:putative FmdB family regulatory protein
MPIYEYRRSDTATGCATCTPGFDRLQRMSDADLSHCPDCGAAVMRVISAPSLAIGGAHLIKEKKVGDAGFTQYRKIGKGVYEKTAGKGPNIISGD